MAEAENAKLRENGHANARLRAMADAAPILLWETDQGGVTFVNQHYLDFFGASFDQIRAMGWSDFLHPDDLEGYVSAYINGFTKRQPYAYECRFRRADGEYRWMRNTGAPVGEDRFAGGTVDITDLLEAQSALKQSEERLILDGVRDHAILTTDPAGNITSWSAGAQATFGWSAEEALGQVGDVLFTREDRAADIPARELSTAEQEGTASDDRWHLTKDGQRVYLSGSVHPLPPDAQGRARGFIKIARDETARRQTSEALRASEALARANGERVQLALAAGAIIGTWHWDLPTDRFTVDEAFAHAFGLDPALGREGIPLAQIVATVHPDDQAGLAAAINEAIARGGAYAHQYRTRRADGRYHWLEANGRVDHGPDGTPLSFPGVLLDVAARRYEAVLVALAERLRTLDTPQAMALAAAETVGVALGLSRAAYGDVDAPSQHIVLAHDWRIEGQISATGKHTFSDYGTYIEDLRCGRDVTIANVATDPRTSAQISSFEFFDIGALANLPLIKDGDLKVVFCLHRIQPQKWTADELSFARRVMDRTEVEIARRAAENELRALNISLEQQVAERTADRNSLWELSTDLMLRCTFEGVFTAVNPAWTVLLGWREDELLGRNLFDLIHPDDIAHTIEGARELSEGISHARFDNRYRHRDGSYRWISWSTRPTQNLINAVGRDITADREQAIALEATADALRQSQKMEAVGQLTGGVAHDFNNLLTIIRSSVDFLRRPNLPEERRMRYMDAVSDTVDRAAKLTGQLLAFARRQALKPETLNVGERLRSVGDMLDTVTGARVRVVIDLPGTPCFIKSDVSQFETAMVNMAVNARDAMNGEGTLTLRLNCGGPMPPIRGHGGGPGPFAKVELSDTGSGIAEADLARIFEPFFTTKEVGKGTGLGLSQVFGFAKQSGGDVDVRSVVGEGTTFTLYLPEVESEAAPAATDEESGPVPDGRGLKVMVVEDNIEVGKFATQILEDLGYRPEWVANAETALERLGAEGDGFDAVFSDVVMPGMGGIALAEELRRRLPRLPVVLASGYSHVLAENGSHGFELLHKPYSADQLSRVLRRVTHAIQER